MMGIRKAKRGMTILELLLTFSAFLLLTSSVFPFLLGLNEHSTKRNMKLAQQLLLSRINKLQGEAVYEKHCKGQLLLLKKGNGYCEKRQSSVYNFFAYSQQGLGMFLLEGPQQLNLLGNGSSRVGAEYAVRHKLRDDIRMSLKLQPITGRVVLIN